MPKTTTTKRAIKKSDFVRSLPDLSAAEVVAKAKEEGISLSAQYVWTIRSADRAGNGSPKAKAKSATAVKSKGKAIAVPEAATKSVTKPTANPATSKSGQSVEDQFLAFVLDVGLLRSQELIDEIRTRRVRMN